MSTTKSAIAGVFVFGALLLAPPDARAVGPVDVEIAAKVGYGTNPSSSPINPLGPGYGLRAGVVFHRIYAGASFMHYLGDPSTSGNASQRADLFGVELGYGVKIAHVTLRPQVGVGIHPFTTSEGCTPLGGPGPGCGGPYVASLEGPYLEPGLTVLVAISILIVGGDVNALLFPGGQVHGSLTAHGQIGVRF